MNNQRHQDDDRSKEAPDRLVRALAELESGRVAVPPAVDEVILREARRHLRPAPRDRDGVPVRRGWNMAAWFGSLVGQIPSRGGRVLRWAAAAAAVVLTAWLIHTLGRPHAVLRVEDFNRDGQVDIRDAFALAHAVERSGRLTLHWDLNGDGVVDRHDADLIATRAVTLDIRERL